MPPKMDSTEHSTSGLLKFRTLSAAVVSALLFSNASAAGLGKLTVLSSLGQPLRAEIDLTFVSKDEAGALVAKLASAEAFRQANVEFVPALSSLRFAVEQRGERQLIHVTSAQPINEPFVDMLMELAGPNGRLVREYTILLEPADLRTTQPAQVASAAVPQANTSKITQPHAQPEPAQPVEKPAKSKPVADAKSAQPAPSEAAHEASDNSYKIKSGDTLSRIAGQMQVKGISLDQMLVALYRANPEAFVGKNMNRLRAGQILSVPKAEVAQGIPAAEAKSEVLAQSVDFNNYRNKLAGQVATAAPQKTTESKQSAVGNITAKVEEPATPDSESKDKLKLAKANAAAGSSKRAGVSAEEKIANDKAMVEANSRVKELEKNVTDLQKVLEVKNKGLAEQQKQADSAKSDVKPAPAAAAASASASTPTAPAASAAPAASTAHENPASADPDKAAAASTAAAAPAADMEAASVPLVAAKKPKRVVVPPPPPPEPSLLDDLKANLLTLPGLGGLGALLVGIGALGVLNVRRKKQKQFEDSFITDSSLAVD
jgi:pilus assembly protein FimV